MSELLFLVPSRGRPGKAQELIKAWFETMSGDSELLLLVDDDDPCLDEYLAIGLPGWATIQIGPRRPVAQLVNEVALEEADKHIAIGFMGDDHRPRTPKWDEAILEVLLELRSGVVYGNDLFQGRNLPTAVVITSDIVRALGWFSPPGLKHMYMDNAWLALGEGLKRLVYMPEIVIEHMHPMVGKAGWDEGYHAVNNSEVYAHDKAVLAAWLKTSYTEDIARVKAAIEG